MALHGPTKVSVKVKAGVADAVEGEDADQRNETDTIDCLNLPCKPAG